MKEVVSHLKTFTNKGCTIAAQKKCFWANFTRIRTDMENLPSKPSPARVVFFGSGKFSYEHTRLFLRMTNILFSMLYQAVGGKIILG